MERVCQVCCSPGAKRYYNGIVCGSCRVFFYRSILDEPPSCSNTNNCKIFYTNPKGYNCPACRFKRCLEIKMDPFKVGIQKRLTKVRAISSKTICQFMKNAHCLLIEQGPYFVPARLETIAMCHRLSMNAEGPSPSLTLSYSLNVSLFEVLKTPAICSSRETACFDQIAASSNSKIEYDFSRSYCRWLLSYADLLESTHFFSQLVSKDQLILAQYNFTDYLLFSVLELKLKSMRTGVLWKTFSHNFCINNIEFQKLLKQRIQALGKFVKEVLEPVFYELNFDEMEFLALKIISLFSLPPNISEDGVKKVHFIREAFIMQLMEYIQKIYPHLTGAETLLRLRKLLEIMRYSPKFIYYKGQIREGLSLEIDRKGIITSIEETTTNDQIEDVLVVPGFVNAHSHAFHRHLRGKSEIGGKGADTFWKWRDNMYGLVEKVTEEQLYEYCLSTFSEMLSAGITCVGEFHYVHHGEGKFDLDKAVIRAAKDVGIRIVLIQTLYERAGFQGGDLHPVQKRFTSSFEEFAENLEKLLKEKDKTVRIAVAAHSTRAVPFENIQRLHELAKKKELAFHMHLEEQPKEIVDCFEVNKMAPSDLLLQSLNLGEEFTAVHATYTSPENMKNFSQKTVNICVCPLTEGYLGDGIPDINVDSKLCFGTDCNNRIGFLEEMRWACFSQQMKNNTRSFARLNGYKLLDAATIGGARSLRVLDVVGSFEKGKEFDAVFIDTTSPSFKNASAEELVDMLVFGAGNREIRKVLVAGEVKFGK